MSSIPEATPIILTEAERTELLALARATKTTAGPSPNALVLSNVRRVTPARLVASSIARTLVANDPASRSINVAYRGLAEERRNVLQHRVFYEPRAHRQA
jgi:hypothetical protein